MDNKAECKEAGEAAPGKEGGEGGTSADTSERMALESQTPSKPSSRKQDKDSVATRAARP